MGRIINIRGVVNMELPQNSYRVSIISSCNMQCEYCHNEGNKVKSMLTKEDIELLVKN